MPLYRTISDRGLWKKNQKNEDPRPQHFHKPSYIDKSKPVITYSQLQLGDGYRYNSKQSIPDINKDIDAANARFDEAYSDGFSSRRNRNFKSCPTTPRATTPTRSLSRSRVFSDRESEHDNCYMNGVRARNSTVSQCSQQNPYIPSNLYGGTGQYYPEDDRCSFESRSLTAYSNYSERDSIIDNNYRYPYAKEPTYKDNYDYLYPDPRTIERENPFQSGKTVNYEAENVVNMFLQKSFFPNVLNNNFIEDNKDIEKVDDSNSTVSPSSATDTPGSTNFEPPYATSSPRSRSNSRAAIAELKKSFLAKEPEKPVLQKPKVNKYLKNANQWKIVQPKTITYPKPEQLDNVNIPDRLEISNPMPATYYENHLNGNLETPLHGMESHFMCDTVKAEQVPKLHHAEIIHVRKETTSTSECSSTSSEEEELLDSSRSIMVNINPLPPRTQTKIDRTQTSISTPKLEAPPQKQNIWGPNPRHVPIQKQVSSDLYPSSEEIVDSSASRTVFTHSASTFQARSEPSVEDLSESCSESVANEQHIVAYMENNTENSESGTFNAEDLVLKMSEPDNWKQTEMDLDVKPILPERSFQDPAFANFHESNQTSDKFQQKQKKKGFFSSLFKKPNKRKQPYGDDYIHIERRVENDETSDSDVDRKIQDLHDQSPRFHILKQEGATHDSIAPGLKPVVPMPGSTAHRQLFSNLEISAQHNAFPPIEQNFDASSHGKYSVSDTTNSFQQIQTFQTNELWSESAHHVVEGTTVPEMIGQHEKNSYNISIEQKDENYMIADNISQKVDLQRKPSDGKPTDLDAMLTQQQVQPSLERKLSISKPTNLDDLTNHTAEFHSIIPQGNREREIVSPFIPEHERTQEIDIDALLALPETPEETEEEVEAENLQYVAADPSDIQVFNQREIAIEQLKLEEEQRYLENQNMVLQQQLMEKENERLRDQTNVLSSMLVQHSVESGYSEFNQPNNGIPSDDLYRSARQEEEKNNELISSEENTDNEAVGRRRPKNFFNFNSFRKPKQKDKANNIGKSESETSAPSDSDTTPDDVNKEFSQVLVEKRSKGISNVFSLQKAKNRHSYHPTVPEEQVSEYINDENVSINTFVEKAEVEVNVKQKVKRKGFTDIFKTNETSLKPSDSSSLPKQEDKELYPIVTQNSRLSSTEDVSDDLATQIVREIQKSTTELNFKSQSMPKLNSNKNPNKNNISSVFASGGIRMSMRKSKKKEIKEEDPTSSSCNEDNEKESKNENEVSEDIATDHEHIHDSRPRSHSLHQKKEKKSTFGEMFGIRSSSRDRKQARRPISEGNIKNSEEHQNGNEDTNEILGNGGEIPLVQASKRKEAKPQSGLGALFGSTKQKKQRSKSQERNKKPQQQLPNDRTDQPERGIESVADLLAQNPVKQSAKKPQTKGLTPLFGNTMRAQNVPGNQNNPSRPMERPPLPPTSATPNNNPATNLHSLNNSYSYSPSPTQSNNENLQSQAIIVDNQRISPNNYDTQQMGRNQEESLRSSRLSSSSPAQQTPDVGQNALNDSGTPGKMRQTGRQSGRFRKSSTMSNISGIQTNSSNLQRQTSFSSQAATNDAQSMFMDSIIADPQSRPITPHNPEPRKKVSSISRTESYRKARGQVDDTPRMAKRNDTYNSLPRSKKQVRQLRPSNSEDSLRNAINREENVSPPQRQKSGRQGRKGKDGECSVM